MHRSSESVGVIAAALAKAQLEIMNPEKSLVAVIPPSGPRELGRAFRSSVKRPGDRAQASAPKPAIRRLKNRVAGGADRNRIGR